jgi:hypothetical protein
MRYAQPKPVSTIGAVPRIGIHRPEIPGLAKTNSLNLVRELGWFEIRMVWLALSRGPIT